ncbi:fused MFS/spermidine synthase [Achromobacter arsenitoxydans]|uniref:Spermine/spermidine synthase family protein 1 n=1 Tax=Achromobacter arsenitoxydans SY8 TaxID=477184 RepID=H0FCE4_9BURK|nr:fused MFS/spermidine synthase [Achromobacter arsenitoxydans]EHK64113.1 spermine/spermidine synthase family protein 1 [Achromobacter arsenitoxydans SY8]
MSDAAVPADLPFSDEPAGVRRPFIQNAGNRRTLHFTQQEIQSSMSLLNPDALEIEYTRMMMGFVLFKPEPAHILMVGLGGGSLPKFCHRYLAGADISVVEIDPAVIGLRDAFMIPPDGPRFRVIQADAAAHMRGLSDDADVIFLDGFEVGGIPDALCSADFYADCHRALRDDGILVINFHVNHPMHHEYLDRVRESFGSSMFEVVDDDMTNSIVFACKGNLLDDPAAAQLTRPASISKDAWRQLMPTLKVIGATLELR